MREQLSCLFENAGNESEQIHQALQIKRSTPCHIWRLNRKSHISMQDSYLVVEDEFAKEWVNGIDDRNLKLVNVQFFGHLKKTFSFIFPTEFLSLAMNGK